MFNALVLNQANKSTEAEIQSLNIDQLPAGNVLVDVAYSSLNYKDGMAITGKGKIIKQFPMVPGIDFVGQVSESEDSRYQAGDWVILTGWGVGESHWGGMAEKARVQADWLVPLPDDLKPKNAMMIGTAGLTGMLCVQALLDGGLIPEQGDVLVTGASGGVGSVAVSLLSSLGYSVAAVTGRVEQNGPLLKQLGAQKIIDREDFNQQAKPLESQLWAGCIDTVGDQILAKALAQMQYGATVAACGLAGGYSLPTTVMPFILRNVRLQGVDSVMCPFEKRTAAWRALLEHLPESYYVQACQEVTLSQAIHYAQNIIEGQVTGRVVIKL